MLNPFIPLPKGQGPSFTAEKALLVVMPIMGAGCIAAIGALFFTFGPGTIVIDIALASTASLSGSVVGLTLRHVYRVKWNCLLDDAEEPSDENSANSSFREVSSSSKGSLSSLEIIDLDEGYESDKSISFRYRESTIAEEEESPIEEPDVEFSDNESFVEEPPFEHKEVKSFLDWYFKLPEENPISSEAKEKLRLLIEEHWDFCAEGYPEGALEEDFHFLAQTKDKSTPVEDAQKLFAWMRLIPFFLRFFEVIGDKRMGLLTWAQKNSGSLVDLLYLHDEFKILKKLSLVNHFLFESIIKMFLPFNDLLKKEGFSGREFLFDLIHQLLFETVPQVIKLEKAGVKKHWKKLLKQEKDNEGKGVHPSIKGLMDLVIAEEKQKTLIRYFTMDTQIRVLLPHLSALWIGKGNVERFLMDMQTVSCAFDDFSQSFKKFEDIRVFFSAFKIPTVQREKRQEGFFECTPTINTIAMNIKENYRQIVMEDAVNLIAQKEDIQKRAKYEDLLSEYRKIGDDLFETISKIFGTSIEDPADYFVKSSLLAQEIADLFPSIEDKAKIIDRLLKMLIQPLKTAEIDTKDIEEYSEGLLKKATEEMSTLSSLDLDGLKLVPFHDVILLLLLGMHVAKHFHQFRPWLSDRKAVFLDLICDTKIDAIVKHRDKIKWALKIGLGVLKPINGLINSQWVPKKSAGIRAAVNQGINILKRDEINKLEAEFRKVHPKEKVPEMTLSASSEALYKIGKPIITFLLVGFFGSNDYERKAMAQLEEILTTFYQKLYSFDPQDRKNLKEHVQECFDSLLDE